MTSGVATFTARRARTSLRHDKPATAPARSPTPARCPPLSCSFMERGAVLRCFIPALILRMRLELRNSGSLVMKSCALGILLSALLCSPGAAPATPPAANEINRPTSQPYTGDLSIFENAKRSQNVQVDRVMDLLAIHAGSAVADIGAGGGWFSVRAARRVGPARDRVRGRYQPSLCEGDRGARSTGEVA